VTSQETPTTNEFGLYVHLGAHATIEAFVRERQVGWYPMYLVGLALPEHRGGPALVTLLTMADGGVVGASARSLGKNRRINGVLGYDVEYLTGDDMSRYRSVFYKDLGGFAAAGCLESSPTAVAEQMLASVRLGLRFGRDVGPSTQGPPGTYPSDWTDVVFYSRDAVGCTVEGFAPSVDAIDALDVPDALKRAMQLGPSSELSWLDSWEEQLTSAVNPMIPGLVREAWAIHVISPRASVGLLRSVAELVVSNMLPNSSDRFFEKLSSLEREWEATPLDASPSSRRESAWRSGVLSCLHTVRDLGNASMLTPLYPEATSTSPTVRTSASSKPFSVRGHSMESRRRSRTLRNAGRIP
jgi:hypothetical protein